MNKKLFNVKQFDSVEKIEGFNEYESAILRENGINSLEEYNNKLPDQSANYEKKIREYLWNNCYITGVEKFEEILKKFSNKHICIIGDYDKKI